MWIWRVRGEDDSKSFWFGQVAQVIKLHLTEAFGLSRLRQGVYRSPNLNVCLQAFWASSHGSVM